jgi:hypothetical protein
MTTFHLQRSQCHSFSINPLHTCRHGRVLAAPASASHHRLHQRGARACKPLLKDKGGQGLLKMNRFPPFESCNFQVGRKVNENFKTATVAF